MTATSPVESLLASLRRDTPRYPFEMREVEISVAAMEFRRAFDLMTGLRDRGLWQLSSEDAESLEDFWWEYCQ